MMNQKTVMRDDTCRMNYLVFHPDDYTDLPLVVYLHGAGERGENTEHIFRLGLPRLLKAGREYPAVILCPQCPRHVIWNNIVEEVKALIDRIAAEYGIGKDRILITGSSMGGYGTWEMAACFPTLFAGAAPVAGGGVPWRAGRMRSLPIKAYHGTADNIVKPIQSQQMVECLPGNAQLILMEGLDHGGGIDHAYEHTDLMDWLLAQRRTDFTYVPEICEEWF